MRDGGILNIYGQVRVEAGAYVCFEGNAQIRVYSGGQLTIDPAAIQGGNPASNLGPLPCAGPPIPATPPCNSAVSLTASLASNSSCQVTYQVRSSGTNVTTNYRWTLNGYAYSSYDGQASILVNLEPGQSTADIQLNVGSSCANTPGPSATYRIQHQFSAGCPQAVVMYPNPASAYVQFTATPPDAPAANDGGSLSGEPATPAGTNGNKKADYKAFKVELYDGRGKKTKYQDTTSGELRLDTSDLPVGLYHITITQGKTVLQKNLSIEH